MVYDKSVKIEEVKEGKRSKGGSEQGQARSKAEVGHKQKGKLTEKNYYQRRERGSDPDFFYLFFYIIRDRSRTKTNE